MSGPRPRSGRLRHFARRALAFVMAASIRMPHDLAADEPSMRAMMRDGRVEAASLAARDAGSVELMLRDGRRVAWNRARRIEPQSPPVASPPQPFRRIVLRGGDTLTAAPLDSSDRGIRLRLADDTFDLPWGAIDSIESPPGGRCLLFEDFASSPTGWTTEAGTPELERARGTTPNEGVLVVRPGARIFLPAPPHCEAGRVSVWFRIPERAEACGWAVEIELSPSKGEGRRRLTARFDRSAAWPELTSDPPRRFDHQPLAADSPSVEQSRWRSATVALNDGRVQVIVDGRLRAAGRIGPGTVEAIRLIGESAAPSENRERRCEIGFVQVVRHESGRTAPPPFRDRRADVVRLVSGDEIIGKLVALDSKRVVLESAGRTLSTGWPEIERLGVAPRAVELPVVSGSLARVVLATPSDQPLRAGDAFGALEGAVRLVDDRTVELRHPLLDRVRLPLRAIARIEPLDAASFRILDPDRHHLGTAVRAEFLRPIPEGTERTIEFQTDPPPEGSRVELVVTVRDLEPSGPDAPPGTPFLAELRAGGLRTDVRWNDVDLGDMNSKIRFRRGVEPDQSIRLTIPPGAWKRGANTLRFVQRPARNDPSSFDDCEIGPIRLETRFAPARAE